MAFKVLGVPSMVASLLRSLTTTQRDAITSPASGTMIFNSTTARPNYYDGSAWQGLYKVLNSNTTSVGTDADLLEKTLWTYTLPAATLAADGQTLRITVYGVFGANANTKTVKLYFGATSFVLNNVTTAPNGVNFFTQSMIVRTGAATQLGTRGALIVGSALQGTGGVTGTETLSGAIVIKVTGQNGIASANDIILRGSMVELLN